MRVDCPNELNVAGYFEILKKYEQKWKFQDIIFQQDNVPVHKSKDIGNFFGKNERKVLEWQA